MNVTKIAWGEKTISEESDKALSEPEEGDVTTTDNEHWYADGRLYHEGDVKGLVDKMLSEGWFPNVWWISDHGNAHPVDVSREYRAADRRAKTPKPSGGKVPDQFHKTVRCPQCEALVINGVAAHETGCPLSKRPWVANGGYLEPKAETGGSKMEKTFNLKKHLEKTAFYEGAQGYMQAQTRAWMNCVRAKLASGKGPQDCWMGCLEEYQKGEGRLDWVQKYAQDLADKFPQEGVTHLGSYAEAITKKVAAGQPVSNAVSEAICELGVSVVKTAEETKMEDRNCERCGKVMGKMSLKAWKAAGSLCDECGADEDGEKQDEKDRKG